ncbi:MAG: hypothetical protein K8S54_13060 [Spirochaetia bacterium]|nr:hypothetical protein [Spirochaetia bacterium]
MKNKSIAMIGLCLAFCSGVFAEEKPTLPLVIKDSGIPRNVDQRKGTWSFQWGYNREAFTQSDINFRGPGYRFTLKEVVAKDKPERVGGAYVDPSKFDIPQFSWRLTRFITDRFSISFGQDHMKYVVTRGQASNIYGYIDPLAIQRAHLRTSVESAPYLYVFPAQYKQYEGYHIGEPFNITPDFLKFDHTDGLNYLAVEAGFTEQIWMSDSGEQGLSFVSALGAGPIVCKSDVRLFGEGRNNAFHISGYGLSARVGLKFEFLRSFFFEATARQGYADLTSILTTGRSKDRASQNFGFLEKVIYFGYTR